MSTNRPNGTSTRSIPQVIKAIWYQLEKQLSAGCKSVSVPFNVKAIVGQAGVDTIVEYYSKTTGCGAVVSTENNVLVISPDASWKDSTYGARAPTATSVLGKKCPRPPNRFILYRQTHHARVVEENPGIHNNEISKILGAAWKSESEETHQYFADLALVMKEKHFEEHPDYAYQPRKSSDKKRRMSSKKQEKLKVIAALMADSGFDGMGDLATDTDGTAAKEVAKFDKERYSFAQKGVRDYVIFGDPDTDEAKLSEMLESHNQVAALLNAKDSRSYRFDSTYMGPAPTTIMAQQSGEAAIDWAQMIADTNKLRDIGNEAAKAAHKAAKAAAAASAAEHLQEWRFGRQRAINAEIHRKVNKVMGPEDNGEEATTMLDREDYNTLFAQSQ